MVSISLSELITFAQYGGGVLAFFLLLAFVAQSRGWFVPGKAAEREVNFWKDLATEYKTERDDYKKQIEARQNVVEQALELATVLKEFTSRDARK